MPIPQISLITTFHAEGRLAEATVKSWKNAIARAQQNNIEVEWICILDDPDAETKEFCASRLVGLAECFEVAFDDVSGARNFGIQKSSGKYVCVSDADDLISENWLANAFAFLESDPSETIAHAEHCVFFERKTMLAKLPDGSNAAQLRERLLASNLWTALSIGKRDLFLNIPYPVIDTRSGFGYEDWLWNCDTVNRKIQHKTVPDTIHCVRLKTWKPSLLSQYQNEHLQLPATKLFDIEYSPPISDRKVSP